MKTFHHIYHILMTQFSPKILISYSLKYNKHSTSTLHILLQFNKKKLKKKKYLFAFSNLNLHTTQPNNVTQQFCFIRFSAMCLTFPGCGQISLYINVFRMTVCISTSVVIKNCILILCSRNSSNFNHDAKHIKVAFSFIQLIRKRFRMFVPQCFVYSSLIRNYYLISSFNYYVVTTDSEQSSLALLQQ